MEAHEVSGKLLDPIKSYKQEFAKSFLDRLTARFEELVSESNLDVEANRKSVAEHEKLSNAKSSEESTLSCLKIVSWILIIAVIIIGYLDWQVIDLVQYEKYRTNENYQMLALYTGIIIVVLIFNFTFISRKKRECVEKIKNLAKEIRLKEEECWSQVLSLLVLFKSNIANKIITEVLPKLNLDEYFNIERYAQLVDGFDMPRKMDRKLSTTDVLSGEMLGNPFIIAKSLKNQVVSQEYTGSRTVSWTEYYYEDGKRKSRTESETLYATVVKPKQVFNDEITLYFGSDVAEHLNFTREPNFIHELNDKKVAKYVKSQSKAIKKKTEKAIKNGDTFLEMQNLEFDSLFGALDRNHEVEFRVLFTPIAQKNMLDLLKDKDFGDDFYFFKNHKLNRIINRRDWIINIDRQKYHHFSFDEIKKRYFELNQEYFSNFYRLFLPILSIPVYHQHKTKDYIYESQYQYKYNPYVGEMMANELGADLFKHKDSGTRAILKTNFLERDETTGSEYFEVLAMSYKTVTRTDYVSTLARNGRWYDVPVDWIDYVPIAAAGSMEVKKLDLEENEFETMASEKYVRGTYSYKNNIFAKLSNKI